MDFSSANHVEEALSRLAALLDAADADPIALLVCGGAALMVQGYVPRTTHDVDVLTYFSPSIAPDPHLERHVTLPEPVREMVVAVSADMDIDENWLSLGPSGLVSLGLPDGLISRTARREYGSSLVVHYLDRLDQIHLKLYASLSREPRHIQDLLALRPTPEEMRRAKEWVKAVGSDGFLPSDLDGLMEELGY